MGRPQFDEKFARSRVTLGEVIDSDELGQRLCYELQIPQRFSRRVYKAVSRVLCDAFANGEGIRFQDLGVLRVKKYNNTTVRLPDDTIVDRKRIFKVVFDTTLKGDAILENLTTRYKESNGLTF